MKPSHGESNNTLTKMTLDDQEGRSKSRIIVGGNLSPRQTLHHADSFRLHNLSGASLTAIKEDVAKGILEKKNF